MPKVGAPDLVDNGRHNLSIPRWVSTFRLGNNLVDARLQRQQRRIVGNGRLPLKYGARLRAQVFVS